MKRKTQETQRHEAQQVFAAEQPLFVVRHVAAALAWGKQQAAVIATASADVHCNDAEFVFNTLTCHGTDQTLAWSAAREQCTQQRTHKALSQFGMY